MANYFYEFNITTNKLGLILISLGSTFTHSSWSWLIFLEYKGFCDIFHHWGDLERKVLQFSWFFFLLPFCLFAYFSEPTQEILQDFCTKRTAFCVFLIVYCQATEEHNRGNLGQESCCPGSFMSSQAIFVLWIVKVHQILLLQLTAKESCEKNIANDTLHVKNGISAIIIFEFLKIGFEQNTYKKLSSNNINQRERILFPSHCSFFPLWKSRWTNTLSTFFLRHHFLFE